MAQYPIKMLKDENGTPFVPLVAPEAVKDGQGFNLQTVLGNKLEKTNIIAGDNITLSVSGNNITINSQAGGATTNVIDNLNQQTAGVGVLDAHQGYVLKGMIPGVQNSLTSTSTTDALSAYQGYLLSNRVVPGGGTTGQVLKKKSNTDNDLEWGSLPTLATVATTGAYSDLSGKPTIPTVINNVTSTSTTSALSANQGKILNDKFSNYLLTSSIVNNLTSTSTTAPLSAAQGKALNDVLSSIGSFVSSGAEITATATQGQSNNICSISLPAGTWLVIGHWRYEGNEVSSYTAIENISLSLPDSVFDDNGWVNKTVIGIQQSGTATTPYLNLWPRNKTISVKCAMYAIRIK